MQSVSLAIDLASANDCCSAPHGANSSPRVFSTLDKQLSKLAVLKDELEGKGDGSGETHTPGTMGGRGGNESETPSVHKDIDKLSPEVLFMRRARLQSEWNEVLHDLLCIDLISLAFLLPGRGSCAC